MKLKLILALLAVYIIWGTTYLANRYGLLGIKPFVLGGIRYTAVAALLFAWCGIRKLPRLLAVLLAMCRLKLMTI